MGQAFNEADHPRGRDGQFVNKLKGLPGALLLVMVAVYVVINYRAGARVESQGPPTSLAATDTTAPAAAAAAVAPAATDLVATPSAGRVQGVVVDRSSTTDRYVVAVRTAGAEVVSVEVAVTEWPSCTVGSAFDNGLQPVCILAK